MRFRLARESHHPRSMAPQTDKRQIPAPSGSSPVAGIDFGLIAVLILEHIGAISYKTI